MPRAFPERVNLHEELAALPPALPSRLAARGFDPAQLEAWAATIGKDRDRRNRLPGKVEPPYPGDLADVPAEGTAAFEEHRARGQAALARRRGRALRARGRDGHAHGRRRQGAGRRAAGPLVPRPPARRERARRRGPPGARLPLWMMTSEATDGPHPRGARRPPRRRLPHDLRAVRLAAPHPGGRALPRRARRAQRLLHRPRRSAGRAAPERALRPLPRPRRQDGVDRQHRQPRRDGRPGGARPPPRAAARPSPWSWSTRSAAIAAAGPCAGTGGPSSRRSSASRSTSTRRRCRSSTRTPSSSTPRRSPRSRWSGRTSRWRRRSAGAAAVQFERILGELTAALEPRFLRVPRAGALVPLPPGQGRARARRSASRRSSSSRARGA